MRPDRKTEAAIYCVLALIGVLPALSSGGMPGDGADAFGTYWFYAWLRRCVENGWNPGYTLDFFYPIGKDILAHTGNNFVDAVLSVPFQWLFGPVLYLPLFIVAIQLGNALTFRVLARAVARRLGRPGLVFPATLLWMCNPYVLFELTAGRPTQAVLWFYPAAAVYALALLERTDAGEGGGAGRAALGLGLSVACAGWTYWFELYFLSFLLLPIWLAGLQGHRAPLRAWGWLAAAVAVCGAAVAPGVAAMAGRVAAGGVPGLPTAGRGLLELPVELANNVSADLHGLGLVERFGAPLLTQPAWALILLMALAGAAGIGAARIGDRRLRRGLAGAFALGALLGMGPVLWDSGAGRVWSWPYLALYNAAPFFGRLWFPYRIASICFLPLALWGGRLAAGGGRRAAWTLAALVALSLGGQARGGVWPFAARSVELPALLAEVQARGATGADAILTLPFGIQSQHLIAQAQHGLPTLGGMGESARLLWPPGWKAVVERPVARALIQGRLSGAIRLGTGTREAQEAQAAAAVAADWPWWEQRGYRRVLLDRALWLSQQAQRGRGPQAAQIEEEMSRVVAEISRIVGAEPVAAEGALVLWERGGRAAAWPEGLQATAARLAETGWAAQVERPPEP